MNRIMKVGIAVFVLGIILLFTGPSIISPFYRPAFQGNIIVPYNQSKDIMTTSGRIVISYYNNLSKVAPGLPLQVQYGNQVVKFSNFSPTFVGEGVSSGTQTLAVTNNQTGVSNTTIYVYRVTQAELYLTYALEVIPLVLVLGGPVVAISGYIIQRSQGRVPRDNEKGGDGKGVGS